MKTATFLSWLVVRQVVPSMSFSYQASKASATSDNSPITYDANLINKIASSAAKTERREVERQRGPRETCSRCSRPPDLCVCESLPEKLITTSTTILVLQHPRERRRKSLSTVPLMPLVLDNIEIKVGFSFEIDDLELVKDFLASGRKPLLLFPGKDAISLDRPPDGEKQRDIVERIQSEDQLLIVLDGTWSEALGVFYRSPDLTRACQQVQFKSDTKSIYPEELRKEPKKHCISTLESCATALTLLEPGERASQAKQYLEFFSHHNFFFCYFLQHIISCSIGVSVHIDR